MSLYEEKIRQYEGLIEGETDEIALLSNTSAFVYEALEEVNWAGFYLAKEEELILGPFQGRVACYRIPFVRGVCGWVARSEKAIIVPDVHQFEGHIACDERSRSEIVIPIFRAGKLYGVLDVDSSEKDNFCVLEQVFLQEIVDRLEKKIA